MSPATDPIEHSVDVAASCERVFDIYTAVSRWPEWDPDLEGAGIDGPFQTGTLGWIKPLGAPRMKTLLVDVQPGLSFTAESRLPGCRLRFHHQLRALALSDENEGSGRQTRVTHSIEFHGVVSGLFRRVLGPRMQDAFPGAMTGLKAAAEAATG